jgi:hypothetical protein
MDAEIIRRFDLAQMIVEERIWLWGYEGGGRNQMEQQFGVQDL